MIKTNVFLISILCTFNSCQFNNSAPNQSGDQASVHPTQAIKISNKDFDQYWYNGEAEINSYQLEQVRYGEIHEGEAVLVFVTEPFSRSKQVKLDNPQATPEDKVSVMKMNLTKKFYTGVYPYSIMLSTFTPIDQDAFPNTLKVSTSVQEWCGHTFTQYNLNKKGYRIQEHSYFESEGESEHQLGLTLLEDELWSKIRINPVKLPTGEHTILPGSINSRLKHTGFKTEQAILTLKEATADPNWMTYQIDYQRSKRSLSIHFSKTFPHHIQGWEETHTNGLVSKAKLKKSMQLDYWSRNRVADEKYREALDLK